MYSLTGEQLKHGGDDTTKTMLLCALGMRRMAQMMEAFASCTLSRRKETQLQNHKLISGPRKVLLRIILNRISTTAEELLAEKQGSFRPGRSTCSLPLSHFYRKDIHRTRQIFSTISFILKSY